MTKIYIVSDVHLEYQWFEPPVPSSNDCLLVIAGDLGIPTLPSYTKYLTMASSQYKYVIVIAGNHEYYSKIRTMAQTRNIIRDVCKQAGENIYFLNSEEVTLEGIRFLGCTLWTDLTPVFDMKPCTNDFKMIKDLNLAKYQELHLEQRAWLTENLRKKERTIVITHHPPSFSCVHKRYSELGRVNSYYYSNMDELVPSSILWIAGHTHNSTLTYIKDVPIVINPVGYPGEVNDFNHQLYVNVEGSTVEIHGFKGQVNKK